MSDIMGSLETDLDKFTSGGNLEKAYILILPGSSPAGGAAAAAAEAAATGAGDVVGGISGVASADDMATGGAGTRIEFLFNPTHYTIEKSAEWTRTLMPGGRPTAVPTFTGSGPRTMSVEILLDAAYAGSGGVQGDIDTLFGCCQPSLASLLLGPPTPPFVMFGWGKSLGFLAFMKSVRVEYELFKPDGTPIRANCSLTMEEIPSSLPMQNPTSGGSARRIRMTTAGDTLQSISYQEYGKPTFWRAIAHANGIEDPTRVAPGTNLLIPPLQEAVEIA